MIRAKTYMQESKEGYKQAMEHLDHQLESLLNRKEHLGQVRIHQVIDRSMPDCHHKIDETAGILERIVIYEWVPTKKTDLYYFAKNASINDLSVHNQIQLINLSNYYNDEFSDDVGRMTIGTFADMKIKEAKDIFEEFLKDGEFKTIKDSVRDVFYKYGFDISY